MKSISFRGTNVPVGHDTGSKRLASLKRIGTFSRKRKKRKEKKRKEKKRKEKKKRKKKKEKKKKKKRRKKEKK